MKVFADNIITNFGISRLETAFKKYSKGVEFVSREKEADLVIIYAYGQRRKVDKRIKWILERGQKYVMVQLAVRSTANPKTEDWIPFWEKAEQVWGYYDLMALAQEDDNYPEFNFYYAPLGVDADLFQDKQVKRIYKVMVGDNRDESVNECVRAAKGEVSHLGIDVEDEHLALHYSQCQYVSGLRRKEGFEMPVIEGLLCGARPICYDKPHFRHWFEGLAEFIPEAHPEEVVKSLETIFAKSPRPVSEAEKLWVKGYFDWDKIIEGFWRQYDNRKG
jgi:hypothetical protein